jgi:hypothetical protein
LSELPGGCLLITGGVVYDYEEEEVDVAKDAVMIDTLREGAVSSQPPMHTARQDHAAVYHSQYLYVLGGSCWGCLDECERYVCRESRWEKLPALPVAGEYLNAVVLDNALYALGGSDDEEMLDTVQKLSLNSLTWELMQLKLPQAAYYFPCFKKDTEVYLVIENTLYSFTPLQVKPIKTLSNAIIGHSSYYSRGTLYYEHGIGIKSLGIGELTSL